MFGIAVARLDAVSDEEKARYQALYCGLCRALKRRYGQVSRSALSYDLAFLAMLYNSLWEPSEERGSERCVAHPAKRMPFAISEFTYYCADLSVALAYHKCLDDVADDRSVKGRVAAAALARAYAQCASRIPEHASVVAAAMRAIREMERDPATPPDATSVAFGEMLAFLFECVPGRFPDLWSGTLRELGYWLGRLICLMDAAVDYAADARSGAYNPFVRLNPTSPDPHGMRVALGTLAGAAARAFEKLPCVQDVHLLRSVLYAGVWQKFNGEYEDETHPANATGRPDKQQAPAHGHPESSERQGRVEYRR